MLTRNLLQDDVVSKPFRIPDLVPKIEELMVRYPMPEGAYQVGPQVS